MAHPQKHNPKEKQMATPNKQSPQKGDGKQTPPPVEVKTSAPVQVTPVPADGKERKQLHVETPAEEKVRLEKEAADAAAQKLKDDAAKAAAEGNKKPATPKVELKCGNPLGSAPSQFVREGSAVHRVYQYLTLPLDKAMTVEEMAKDLHSHMPTHPFDSVLTNVRVEIAASKRKRGMDVGRDAKGRYNVNIPATERSKARVLTPEQEAEKKVKAEAREKAKAERLAKLTADRAAKKEAKEKAKAEEAAKKAAEQKADAAKTPEQVQAELAAMGVTAKVS